VFITQNGDWPALSDEAEFRFFDCDGLVCTNPDYFERNRHRYKCALIPNGVDLEAFRAGPRERSRFGLPEEGRLILMVSALIPSKNVAEGIAAIACLPDTALVVAGDGPLRDDMSELAKKLLPGRYYQLTAPAAEMPALYRSADAFMHLSTDESFGNVFVEAVATGLPVVAYDTPRTRWIIGDEGFYPEARSCEALSQAISAALTEPGPVARKNRERAQAFSWSGIAKQYVDFFGQGFGAYQRRKERYDQPEQWLGTRGRARVKWVFLLAVLLSIPVLTRVFRNSERNLVWGCFVLGASLFLWVPNFWSAPIPWPGWQGPIHGLEVSCIDGVTIAMVLATKPVRIPLSVKLAFGLFCVGLAVSTIVAYLFMPAFFYIVQVIRSVFLFLAVARACGTAKEAPYALLAGLGVGLTYEAINASYQHYINGVLRPGGNLGHSNFLGLASDFVTFPVLALLLSTRRLWPAAVVISGLMIAVVGGSRATMGLFAIGVLLTFLFSLMRGVSGRKMGFGLAAVFMLLIAAPAMISSVHRRTEQSLNDSDAERSVMKVAAKMIIGDHPLGVGANQYVMVNNTGGYAQRAGMAWNFNSRAAPVHDVYYLWTAELGWLGLAGSLATIASLIALGFSKLRTRGADEAGDIIPGLLATMIIAADHMSYEWVFMTAHLHYMFAIAAGLMVAVAARTSKAAQRRPAMTRLPEPVHA
jgi:hypothetical protein